MLPEASTADSKTPCTPPRTVLAVALCRRSDLGVSKGLGSYYHPPRILAWLKGERQGAGAEPWELCPGVMLPIPVHNPGGGYWAAVRQCHPGPHLEGKVERENGVAMFPPPQLAAPLSHIWRSNDSTTPILSLYYIVIKMYILCSGILHSWPFLSG